MSPDPARVRRYVAFSGSRCFREDPKGALAAQKNIKRITHQEAMPRLIYGVGG